MANGRQSKVRRGRDVPAIPDGARWPDDLTFTLAPIVTRLDLGPRSKDCPNTARPGGGQGRNFSASSYCIHSVLGKVGKVKVVVPRKDISTLLCPAQRDLNVPKVSTMFQFPPLPSSLLLHPPRCATEKIP